MERYKKRQCYKVQNKGHKYVLKFTWGICHKSLKKTLLVKSHWRESDTVIQNTQKCKKIIKFEIIEKVKNGQIFRYKCDFSDFKTKFSNRNFWTTLFLYHCEWASTKTFGTKNEQKIARRIFQLCHVFSNIFFVPIKIDYFSLCGSGKVSEITVIPILRHFDSFLACLSP